MMQIRGAAEIATYHIMFPSPMLVILTPSKTGFGALETRYCQFEAGELRLNCWLTMQLRFSLVSL
jgi:hypothetical protein